MNIPEPKYNIGFISLGCQCEKCGQIFPQKLSNCVHCNAPNISTVNEQEEESMKQQMLKEIGGEQLDSIIRHVLKEIAIAKIAARN